MIGFALGGQEFMDGGYLHVGTSKKERWYVFACLFLMVLVIFRIFVHEVCKQILRHHYGWTSRMISTS